MNKFESYIAEVEHLLEYKEYSQLTKRLIDLTLDTQDVKYYRDMLNHLDWLDSESGSKNQNPEEINERYSTLFLSLKDYLLRKSENIHQEDKVLISVDHLTKNYGNSYFTLGSINFMLRENQMIGLVGENGNGKTTLLRVLAKELNPSSGIVKYGFDYDEDEYTLRSKLVYIAQRTPMWNGDVLTNLQFTAAMYGIKGEENELLVQLVIARMGIRKYRNFNWAGLSSGYKMRFELARALLRNPKVMLIDEPLANLDILAQKNVLDDFKGISSSPFRPIGVLLSSQQLYEVEKNADDVLFLKEGVQKNLISPAEMPNMTMEGVETSIPEALQEPYLVEFETPWDLPTVREKLQGLNVLGLQLNGGTFILTLDSSSTHVLFLQHALNVEMPITYFRDISKSTRRFFLS